ncbi:MAG TPA: DUF4291 domain-containing protein [Clostridiales bacterium]|nr:MAG: hypothetical protein A2Y18_08485 [Clostridiales bacterium GWD2_32_19]HCC07587.1 DUF4291 domain-containing protein [Clostridiales bacterium]
MEDKRIYARFDEKNIRIYQAYNNRIAEEAVRLGTFGSSFKKDRMTWIKPSFLWMMYRSGWGTKDNQERILAIDISREGFDVILGNAVLSAYNQKIYKSYEIWKERLSRSEVRCQWDPDRDIYGRSIGRRVIQLGINGSIVAKYTNDWIVKISDITTDVINWRDEINNKKFDSKVLPLENEYPINEKLKKILGMI